MTYEFIENKTLREYYEKEGIELSDEVKAWLMYRISTFERRWDQLLKLADSLDDGWLKNNIQFLHKYERSELDKFNLIEDGCVYLCEMVYDFETTPERAIFSDPNRAIEFGRKMTSDYSDIIAFVVEKYQINGSEELASVTCNRNGEIEWVFAEVPNTWDEEPKWFTSELPKFPIPYRCGDVVKLRRSEDYGVCLELSDDDTSDDWYKRILDGNLGDPTGCNPDIWLDIVNVETGSVYCHPTNIMDLERISLDEIKNENQRELLYLISCSALGKGSIGSIMTHINYMKEGI